LAPCAREAKKLSNACSLAQFKPAFPHQADGSPGLLVDKTFMLDCLFPLESASPGHFHSCCLNTAGSSFSGFRVMSSPSSSAESDTKGDSIMIEPDLWRGTEIREPLPFLFLNRDGEQSRNEVFSCQSQALSRCLFHRAKEVCKNHITLGIEIQSLEIDHSISRRRSWKWFWQT